MKDLIIKNKKFKNLYEMFKINQEVSIIAGPCSIESYKQMEILAQTLVKKCKIYPRRGL